MAQTGVKRARRQGDLSCVGPRNAQRPGRSNPTSGPSVWHRSAGDTSYPEATPPNAPGRGRSDPKMSEIKGLSPLSARHSGQVTAGAASSQ
jgi:hypothetical protein